MKAFNAVVMAVVALLDKPPPGLVSQITQPARYPQVRTLRRELWSFTRDASTGLPQAALIADTQWHPLLVSRTKTLLANLEAKFGLAATDNVGRKLAKTALPNTPLADEKDLAEEVAALRVDTVHQVKGESLDAVLYLTEKEHAVALLDGVATELGRIGYVAVTRARNLLWLAVPTNALPELRPLLEAKGFREIETAGKVKASKKTATAVKPPLAGTQPDNASSTN